MKKASTVVLAASFLLLGARVIAKPQKVPEQKTPNSAKHPQLPYRPIASGRHRISRETETIAISRGSQDVVVDYFTELMIAKIIDDKADPQKLKGLTVSLCRDAKVQGLWNIFEGGASGGLELTLTENVFRIQQVVSSTEKDPVKVQIDGRVYRLGPGEVLLLLG